MAFRIKRLVQLLQGLSLVSSSEVLAHLSDLQRIWRIQQAVQLDCPSLDLRGMTTFHGYVTGCLKVEERAKIERGCVIAFGDDKNGVGNLKIGKGTWIGDYNNFRIAGGTEIVIGSDCLISQFCSLISANHGMDPRFHIKMQSNDLARKDIVIADDVWIGANSVVLPGTIIHSGAIIGANSTVVGKVPAMEIWAGNPAKRIGSRDSIRHIGEP